MTKWLLIFVVLIVQLIASSSITTDDQVVVESHAILNASDHQQHSSHKAHHGVQVASFRFEEVRAPLVLCTFIILIALFKISQFPSYLIKQYYCSLQYIIIQSICRHIFPNHAVSLYSAPHSGSYFCKYPTLMYTVDVYVVFRWDDTHEAIRFLEFDSHTFFFFLLPPYVCFRCHYRYFVFRIILESAYSLKDKAFIENLGTVVVYAVVVR
jgi:hypothetical protein